MATLLIKKHFEAPLELAFEVLSDLEHAADNIQGIEKLELLTPDGVGVGTRFRETRKMFGKENSEEMEVTAFDPPHGYTVDCESCGCHYRAKYSLVSDIAGTHVRLEFDYRAVSILAKLFSPFSKLMMGPMCKMMEADLDDLKTIAEARARKQTEQV
jgi:carbon monoxide dehydrogenase subunit G